MAEEKPPRQESAQSAKIDRKLLELLVCPLTRQPLEYDRQNACLISRAARVKYPIRGGIPILVADEAAPWEDRPLSPEEILNSQNEGGEKESNQ